MAREPSKEKELSPDNIQKQLQWEDKVVGPQTAKKIDHAKIAALQEQARKDEANRARMPQVAKAPVRATGVAAPSSATIPTQDIEKPAPTATANFLIDKNRRNKHARTHRRNRVR